LLHQRGRCYEAVVAVNDDRHVLCSAERMTVTEQVMGVSGDIWVAHPFFFQKKG